MSGADVRSYHSNVVNVYTFGQGSFDSLDYGVLSVLVTIPYSKEV